MNKVSPEYLPHQTGAEEELFEDLLKKKEAIEEALANGTQDVEDLRRQYAHFLDEVRLNHPEFRHDLLDQLVIEEAEFLTKKKIIDDEINKYAS